MQAAALELIEAELRARGVTPEQVEAHAQARQDRMIWLPDGTAARCSFCDRPAVVGRPGWHRLWGLLPLFPRRFFYCDGHALAAGLDAAPNAAAPPDLP